MIKVFHIHTLPQGHKNSQQEIADLLRRRGVTGAGWRVETPQTQVAANGDNWYDLPEHGLPRTWDVEADRRRRAARLDEARRENCRLLRSMVVGDLAWVRDTTERYFIARVTDRWRDLDHADMVPCEMHPVADADVPSLVRDGAFSRAVQAINDQIVVAESPRIWALIKTPPRERTDALGRRLRQQPGQMAA